MKKLLHIIAQPMDALGLEVQKEKIEAAKIMARNLVNSF